MSDALLSTRALSVSIGGHRICTQLDLALH